MFIRTWLLSLTITMASNTLLASTYLLDSPTQDIVGEAHTITSKSGDSIQSIAMSYELGVDELLQANPSVKKRGRIKSGETLTIPSRYILPPRDMRKGIVINMPEKRLYYFHTDEPYVTTYPVALGRAGWRTPLTNTFVRGKTADPAWRVPTSIQSYMLKRHGRKLPNVMPPGPENPLGRYALYLQETGILIHGTNEPKYIGRLVSSGCIRMHNHHVEHLFENVEVGTSVSIIHQAHKMGTHGEKVFLESHPEVRMEEHQHTHDNNMFFHETLTPYVEARYTLVAEHVDNTKSDASGIPTEVGYKKISSNHLLTQPMMLETIID